MDNTTAVAYVNRRGALNPFYLSLLALELQSFMLWKEVFKDISRHFYVPLCIMFKSLCVPATRPRCYSKGCLSPRLESVDEFHSLLLLPQILQKVRNNKPLALLVAPNWLGQPWYAQIQPMLTDVPYHFPRRSLFCGCLLTKRQFTRCRGQYRVIIPNHRFL